MVYEVSDGDDAQGAAQGNDKCDGSNGSIVCKSAGCP